jgi:hypothetical protein
MQARSPHDENDAYRTFHRGIFDLGHKTYRDARASPGVKTS